jgi:putative tricarboxylic transport membrane protein
MSAGPRAPKSPAEGLMTDKTQDARGAGPSHRSVEIAVTLLTAVFALIVIAGSIQAGIGWGAEGPKAGFIPFYVGLVILGSSIINFGAAVSERSDNRLFAEWGHLGQVMAMLVPTAIYVALVSWIGIYVASALLIAVFMRWLGEYGWGMVAAVSVGVPVAIFVVFEKWFLLPLPKGPIEAHLGF